MNRVPFRIPSARARRLDTSRSATSQGDPIPLLKDFKFDAGNTAIADSLKVLPQTGGNWLAVTGQSSPTTGTIRLAANPSGLTPGRYFSGGERASGIGAYGSVW